MFLVFIFLGTFFSTFVQHFLHFCHALDILIDLSTCLFKTVFILSCFFSVSENIFICFSSHLKPLSSINLKVSKAIVANSSHLSFSSCQLCHFTQ
ncbi:hypothetical protein HOF65_07450 [bacterium]|nr:hypothetical protein [bacterium]MBT3853749.1 hypothetical protein [bacterium]MBT4632951.1 hypothetical protein [bacterium]MBT6779182.1 hypothetical protein [bacterium]